LNIYGFSVKCYDVSQSQNGFAATAGGRITEKREWVL